MRTLLAAIFILLLALSPALAEGDLSASLPEDLSAYSLEELYALRERVDAEILRQEAADALPAYESGVYLVGEDLPAGIYLVVERGYALFPSVLVRAGAEEDSALISYDLVIRCAAIQLSDGLYVTFTDVIAYPFESAPDYGLDAQGEAEEGGYWVGSQIPAAQYQIAANEAAPLSSYSVYDGILGTNAQLLKFEVVSDVADIALEDGQYICLSGCSIALAEG